MAFLISNSIINTLYERGRTSNGHRNGQPSKLCVKRGILRMDFQFLFFNKSAKMANSVFFLSMV